MVVTFGSLGCKKNKDIGWLEYFSRSDQNLPMCQDGQDIITKIK